MIGSIRGRLVAKAAPRVIVDCGGVGYELDTPMSTFLELPALGNELFLHAHLLVREDAQTLYGFATVEEKQLFQSLLRVNGVGAKMGLAILSGMSVEGFANCVRLEDAAALTKIPGVGKKTAERLIIEMRDRLDASDTPLVMPSDRQVATMDPRSEAIEALCALGYKPAEVKRLVAAVDSDAESAEDIIRSALKQVAG